VGEEEIKSGKYKLKNLKESIESELDEKGIVDFIRSK
jgi:hypothetical protein